MRNLIIPFIVLLLFLNACSKKKEETKLSSYNTEAFAYDLGDNSWEVNSTTRVKGFDQKEENGMFKASFAYEIDLVTPKNDTIKSLISKIVDKSEKEKMSDSGLETQFDLDSTYTEGTYKVVWNVKDVFSNQTSIASAEFQLSID